VKHLFKIGIIIALVISFYRAHADTGPTLTATLDVQNSPARTIVAGDRYVDVARITLAASGGDVFLNSIRMAADVPNGLQNFSNILIYDATDDSLLGSWPNQSAQPDLMQFSTVTIGNGRIKTYKLRVAGLSSSAHGVVRIGFSDFGFATQIIPALAGVPVYSNPLTLLSTSPTPTPTGSVSPIPTMSPTPTVSASPVPNVDAALAALNDGDIVQAPGRPPVFVVKVIGAKRFKRWMISPRVLAAYGIPFSRIKLVDKAVLDRMPTSFLFRRFGDAKVYELWDIVEGSTGSRRWIPTVTDFLGRGFDFDAVYTINDVEYRLYTEGTPLRMN